MLFGFCRHRRSNIIFRSGENTAEKIFKKDLSAVSPSAIRRSAPTAVRHLTKERHIWRCAMR